MLNRKSAIQAANMPKKKRIMVSQMAVCGILANIIKASSPEVAIIQPTIAPKVMWP